MSSRSSRSHRLSALPMEQSSTTRMGGRIRAKPTIGHSTNFHDHADGGQRGGNRLSAAARGW